MQKEIETIGARGGPGSKKHGEEAGARPGGLPVRGAVARGDSTARAHVAARAGRQSGKQRGAGVAHPLAVG